MESKHTPGPWHLADTSPQEIRNRDYYVAMVFDDMPELENEHTANAHLIAAAPDLLEACKHTIEILNLGNRDANEGWANDVIDKCQAAIEKAKKGQENESTP